MKYQILVLLFILSLFSCSEPSDHITSGFNEMKTDLDLIIEQLATDPIYKTKLNKFVRTNELNEKSRELLNRLDLKDIYYVILSSPNCTETKEFEIEIIFNGDWHLNYNPCGMTFISPGEHSEMDDHFIESWGLDSHWYLWVNRDFIG